MFDRRTSENNRGRLNVLKGWKQTTKNSNEDLRELKHCPEMNIEVGEYKYTTYCGRLQRK